MSDRYNLSKLVELLAYRQLAAQLHCSAQNGLASVVATYVNPGWCRTELFRSNDGGVSGRIGLRLIGRTAEAGSRTIGHAAVAADGNSHGKYMSECRVKPESTWVRSKEGASVEKRLWKELVDILEGIHPGVTDV
jgi:retinol dehydrogenase-12